jgi:hypothetical protein
MALGNRLTKSRSAAQASPVNERQLRQIASGSP